MAVSQTLIRLSATQFLIIMDHYFDSEQQQEGGEPLTLVLTNPQTGEDPVTETALRDEISNMAEIISVLFDSIS